MTAAIQFGSRIIAFRLEYSDRKSLGITVTPEMEVLVKAPIGTSIEKVNEKIRKKAPWIIKQQSFFLSFQPKTPQRKYISGETHLYLGRQYRLQVIQGAEDKVKLAQGRLVVEIAHPESTEKVKKLLQDWYRLRAKAIFAERYNCCVGLVAKLDINHHQGFQLRFMSKRWGSCTSQGPIILNPKLIAAPKDCIDYVITHELCHLKERNHSQAFYRLLGSAMKDWQLRKKKLNEMVEVRFV